MSTGFRQRHAVIAQRKGDDTFLSLIRIERRNTIHGASELECAGSLEVFCLEEDLSAHEAIEVLVRQHRRPRYRTPNGIEGVVDGIVVYGKLAHRFLQADQLA
jgi:hypothetical protein